MRTSDPLAVQQAPRLPRKSPAGRATARARQSVHQTLWSTASPTPATQKSSWKSGGPRAPKRTSDPLQILQVPRLPRKRPAASAAAREHQSVHQTPRRCSKSHACHAKCQCQAVWCQAVWRQAVWCQAVRCQAVWCQLVWCQPVWCQTVWCMLFSVVCVCVVLCVDVCLICVLCCVRPMWCQAVWCQAVWRQAVGCQPVWCVLFCCVVLLCCSVVCVCVCVVLCVVVCLMCVLFCVRPRRTRRKEAEGANQKTRTPHVNAGNYLPAQLTCRLASWLTDWLTD